MSFVSTISAERAEALQQTARELTVARETGILMSDLRGPQVVHSMEEAVYVQQEMMLLLGPIGGWKVGAPGPEAEPSCAPMPLRWFNQGAANGGTALIEKHRYRGVEAEIAFHMADSLPPRPSPYTRAEVVAAIASCHPAIELLEAAFPDPFNGVERFSQIADLQTNGGFVPGPAIANWQAMDIPKEGVQMIVNCSVEVDRVASNTAGTDLLRLVEWLANVGSVPFGGLKAGDWITSGSWTGRTICASGAVATAKFSTAGSVTVQFA
jgi:2-keto-4-pentenoate hydratase